MRLPKRGERGFTLIELLIVVAILGVLAAVVIPNVTRFVGSGKQEAAETELHNVQLAVTSMMLENGITTIPVPLSEEPLGPPQTNHRNNMAEFPDFTTVAGSPKKLTDPEGFAYSGTTDGIGYILYGHDITGSAAVAPGPNLNQDDINYVTVQMTTYYYTCEADGTVKQWDATGALLTWD